MFDKTLIDSTNESNKVSVLAFAVVKLESHENGFPLLHMLSTYNLHQKLRFAA
ncbi:hypothetical protein CHS0354_007641, partial [Potamilus streckersoni]